MEAVAFNILRSYYAQRLLPVPRWNRMSKFKFLWCTKEAIVSGLRILNIKWVHWRMKPIRMEAVTDITAISTFGSKVGPDVKTYISVLSKRGKGPQISYIKYQANPLKNEASTGESSRGYNCNIPVSQLKQMSIVNFQLCP